MRRTGWPYRFANRKASIATAFHRVCVLMLSLAVLGCSGEDPAPAKVPHGAGQLDSSTIARIEAFCGDCHAMPLPSSFPKHAWRAEVQRGYDFYYAAQRDDLEVPVMNATIDFFVDQAPDELPSIAVGKVDPLLESSFTKVELSLPDTAHAAISFVDTVNLSRFERKCILVSDMRGGGVYATPIQPSEDGSVEFGDSQRLGSVQHPAVVRKADWDDDGLDDLLVADLGTFLPSDTELGQVVWLRGNDSGSYDPQPLVTGLGRVASLEVVDINQDQNTDLLVAEFGWHETGSIFWAERSGNPSDVALQTHLIDSRAGTIHIPTTDLNGDGTIDFFALVSQHFEAIEAFTNDGQEHFARTSVFRAVDPSFGSSGIEITDLNQDGLLDLLYTNGDAFDSFVIKPFHSVRWFEGNADGSFSERELGALPGAHRAVSGDMNGDGHLDVIASAFLPRDVLQSAPSSGCEAIVIWEGSASGTFTRRVLSNDPAIHASIVVDDLNADGKDDIIAGNFREGGTDVGPALTIWISK